MRYVLILAFCVCTPCVAQEQLPDANSEAQAQLQRTYDAINRLSVTSYSNMEVMQEAQAVKQLIPDDDEIVRQLAIFVATTESSEEKHAVVALMIWRYLGVSPDATILILAPYLDTSNAPLRSFVRDWFQGHDKAENFENYKKYVLLKASRKEELPIAFVEYMFGQSPGQAMLVLQKSQVDTRKHIEIARQKRPLTDKERESQHPRQQDNREILLAEHVVSEALWLHENGFNERLQAALPAAITELEKLASRKEWWARLYVAYIMRGNPILLKDHTMRQLAQDENAIVREAVIQ